MAKDKDTFEALYAALEEKARKLEEGGLSLEDSVKTYEEGAGIAVKLREMIEKAELRVRELDARIGMDELTLQEDPAEYDLDLDIDGDD